MKYKNNHKFEYKHTHTSVGPIRRICIFCNKTFNEIYSSKPRLACISDDEKNYQEYN